MPQSDLQVFSGQYDRKGSKEKFERLDLCDVFTGLDNMLLNWKCESDFLIRRDIGLGSI